MWGQKQYEIKKRGLEENLRDYSTSANSTEAELAVIA